ncbi:MAG: DUF2191 domain-containing protein [Actinobacteria bacterium]|nr:DUF2191 domain-containing protein [Actinomycetota bacterium]
MIGQVKAYFLLAHTYGPTTVTHMKTTIEITDWLLEAAKDLARRERTTLRHLVETGLVQVLRDSDATGAFHLRDESFEGRGLQSAFKAAGWEQIHEAIDLHDDQDPTP